MKRILASGLLLLALYVLPSVVLAQQPNPRAVSSSFTHTSGTTLERVLLAQKSSFNNWISARFISHFTVDDTCRVAFFSSGEDEAAIGSFYHPYNSRHTNYTWEGGEAKTDNYVTHYIPLSTGVEYEFAINADVMVFYRMGTGATINYEAIFEY